MGGSDKSNFSEIMALNYTQNLKFQGHDFKKVVVNELTLGEYINP